MHTSINSSGTNSNVISLQAIEQASYVRKVMEGNIETNEPCYALFHGNDGYTSEQAQARKLLKVGAKYRIIGGSMGKTYTTLELEGIPGSWNSVLFQYNEKKAPIKCCHG